MSLLDILQPAAIVPQGARLVCLLGDERPRVDPSRNYRNLKRWREKNRERRNEIERDYRKRKAARTA